MNTCDDKKNEIYKNKHFEWPHQNEKCIYISIWPQFFLMQG